MKWLLILGGIGAAYLVALHVAGSAVNAAQVQCDSEGFKAVEGTETAPYYGWANCPAVVAAVNQYLWLPGSSSLAEPGIGL